VLSNLSAREKKMLYVLLLFLLISIFIQVFIRVMLPSYKEAKLTLEEKKQELAEAHNLVQELEYLSEQKNELTMEHNDLLKKFQLSFAAGHPFDYLDKNDLNLYLKNITPYPVHRTEYYSSLQIDMKITGSYLSVLKYLERIENLPAVTEIVSPTMTITEDEQLVCDFTLNIYSIDSHWKPEGDSSQLLGKYDIFTPLVQALVPAESLPEPESEAESEAELNIINKEKPSLPEEALVTSSESDLQEETQLKENEIYYHFPSR
jgi:Tfp pilus assembly protein PilO